MNHLLILVFTTLLPSLAQESAPVALPKVHKIAVGGEGGWDYLSVDSDARRLYVSRGESCRRARSRQGDRRR